MTPEELQKQQDPKYSEGYEKLKVTTFREKQTNGEGYIFVSYASRNRKKVFDEYIYPLQEQYGARFFADKQFQKNNTVWLNQMSRNLKRSDGMIMFISPEYVCSYACFLEVLTAIKENKPIIRVVLGRPEMGSFDKELDMSDATREAIKQVGTLLELECRKPTCGQLVRDAYAAYLETMVMGNGVIEEDMLSEEFIELIDQISTTKAYAGDPLSSLRDKISSISKDVFGTPLAETETVIAEKEVLQNHSEAGTKEMIDTVTEPAKKMAENVAEEKQAAALSAQEEVATAASAKDATQEEAGTFDRETAPKKRGRKPGSGETFRYTLYGKDCEDSAAAMMANVFSTVLERHVDMLDQLVGVRGFGCISYVDYSKKENQTADMPVYFKSAFFFPIGPGICVGTLMAPEWRLSMMANLIRTVGEDPDEVFQSADVELPAEKRKKESYTVYGVTYSGSAASMMANTLHLMIERHFDKRKALEKQLMCLMLKKTIKEMKGTPAQFRVGVDYEYQGVRYCIGTALSNKQKIRQIEKAIEILGEDPGQFVIDGLGTHVQEDEAVQDFRDAAESEEEKAVQMDFEESLSVHQEPTAEPVAEPAKESEQELPETEKRDCAPKKRGRKPGGKNANKETIRYTLYGKDWEDDAGTMMLNVFAKVLKRHTDMLDQLVGVRGFGCISYTDYTKKENQTPDMQSYFKSSYFLPLGKGICIGTQMGNDRRLALMANLIRAVGEDPDEVFQSEDVELPAEKRQKETYTVYGQTYSGSAASMLANTLHLMLEKHFDQREALADHIFCIKIGKTIAELGGTPAQFAAGADYEYQGVRYCIGTNLNNKMKIRQLERAIEFLGEDPAQFEIEGLEIQEQEEETVRNFLDD